MLYVSIIIFSALLYTYYHFRDRVPILMYHRIASVPGDRNALPEEKFEEQMRYLEENGFHSITVDELQAIFSMESGCRRNRWSLLLMTVMKIIFPRPYRF